HSGLSRGGAAIGAALSIFVTQSSGVRRPRHRSSPTRVPVSTSMSESIAQPASTAEAGIWDSIREALRGSHRDYTEGSVSRSILILAIPMVLEMIMESVFAVCDVFFVSKLGANAVATVGLTESWLTLIYALAMGLAISASAIVARRIGEKD